MIQKNLHTLLINFCHILYWYIHSLYLEILYQKNDVVPVGEVIARIGESGEEIPDKIEETTVPLVDESLQQKIGVLQQELNDYNDTCKKI